MLTFFSIPKAFVGKIGIFQKNAILSWKRLESEIEIILFGNEKGVADFAKKYSLVHFPEIERNRWGTPLLSFALEKAQEKAKNEFLIYANSDLIFFGSTLLRLFKEINFPEFLLTSRRWDLNLENEIFFEKNWEKDLEKKLKKEGKLHGFSGMDWFLFPKKLNLKMPPFAVGRPGWDNWLLFELKRKKIPIIEATPSITVIHQNHPSKYRARDREAKENIKLAKGLANMLTLREADWILTLNGLQKPPLFRQIWSKLALTYPIRLLLAFKRHFF